MMVQCVTKTLSFTTPTFSMSSILAFFLLLPVSSPQMPRFDLPSNSHGPGSKMRSSDQGPAQCPGPGEVPWCQCREDGGGLSFSCQNMNQVYFLFPKFWRICMQNTVCRNIVLVKSEKSIEMKNAIKYKSKSNIYFPLFPGWYRKTAE